jgi:hypothetical protein
MNAQIKLTKLLAHKSSFTNNAGQQFNVLIIPIRQNNLEYISEDEILLYFVCFERTNDGLGQDTHILKQDFTDEQKKLLTKDQIESTPIIGNLVDWNKRDNPNAPKTIISGSINMRKLYGIIRPFRMKDQTLTDCLVINVGANHLYEHPDGALSLSMVLFEIKNPRGSATHTIKLSVSKEIYNSMTEAQQKELPYLGSATRRVVQPKANNDAELEQSLSVNVTDFHQLADDFPTQISDDLPF